MLHDAATCLADCDHEGGEKRSVPALLGRGDPQASHAAGLEDIRPHERDGRISRTVRRRSYESRCETGVRKWGASTGEVPDLAL